jgi:hypothetical protein
MLHFKSYNSMQITQGDESELDDYRMGLTVSTLEKVEGPRKLGETILLMNFNEAVTEELTKQSVKELLGDSLFTDEAKRTGEVINKYPRAVSGSNEPLFNEDL